LAGKGKKFAEILGGSSLRAGFGDLCATNLVIFARNANGSPVHGARAGGLLREVGRFFEVLRHRAILFDGWKK
jgi:hypothetical protein